MAENKLVMPQNSFVLTTAASATATPVLASLPAEIALETWIQSHARELPVTLELPPQWLSLIGKLIAHWAVAEWVLVGTLLTLLDTGRKEGRALFRERNVQPISIIKELMSLKKIPFPSNFSDLSKKIESCQSVRNLLAHGIWITDEESKICIQDPTRVWKANGEEVSKRKYPEAVRVDENWFLRELEKMQQVIRDLEALDKYLENALKK